MIETSPHAPARGFDRTQLEAILAPIARAHGAEVVDVEFKPDQGHWVLRIFVEKAGAAERALSTEDAAVDLELCSGIARDLSPALDVADIIPHRYSLEVSSPGVERILRGEADYTRFAGKKAKLKLSEAVCGQKVLVGLLGPVESGELTVEEGAKQHRVPLANILGARLVFEFGPAPKPGHRPPSGRPGKDKKSRAG